MATFPAIKPSARSYSAGDYPNQQYRTMSGATWKRNFGNTRVGMELDLEFRNISDAQATAILAHYDSAGGTLRRFELPAEVWAGASAQLRAATATPTNVHWVYTEPPDVESVFIGISTVRVRLVGEARHG